MDVCRNKRTGSTSDRRQIHNVDPKCFTSQFLKIYLLYWCTFKTVSVDMFESIEIQESCHKRYLMSLYWLGGSCTLVFEFEFRTSVSPKANANCNSGSGQTLPEWRSAVADWVFHSYCPQMKLWEDNDFCWFLSVHEGEECIQRGCTPTIMHPQDGCTPPWWMQLLRMDAPPPSPEDSQPLAGIHPTGMHTCCWRLPTSFFIVWDQSEEATMRLATSDWVGHCWLPFWIFFRSHATIQ